MGISVEIAIGILSGKNCRKLQIVNFVSDHIMDSRNFQSGYKGYIMVKAASGNYTVTFNKEVPVSYYEVPADERKKVYISYEHYLKALNDYEKRQKHVPRVLKRLAAEDKLSVRRLQQKIRQEEYTTWKRYDRSYGDGLMKERHKITVIYLPAGRGPHVSVDNGEYIPLKDYWFSMLNVER